MNTDLKIILVTFLAAGLFILIKGFQSNLGIVDIFTIFAVFTGYLTGFILLTALTLNLINQISRILFKKV